MIPVALVVGLVFRYYSAFWFVPIYLFLWILFYCKAKSTLKHLNAYEQLMVNKFWKKIQELLEHSKTINS